MRFNTHYDALPHGNCSDPERCDCECDGCRHVKAAPRALALPEAGWGEVFRRYQEAMSAQPPAADPEELDALNDALDHALSARP